MIAHLQVSATQAEMLKINVLQVEVRDQKIISI